MSAVSAADNDTIYVNATGGDDNNNGTSWQYAKLSIKNATGTVNTNGVINLANGNYNRTNNTNITINKNMTIIGESQSGTIINGENTNWIFQIQPGINVTIQNLTLTNGTAVDGGAIYNDGSFLTIDKCTFTDNQATGNNYGGGAILNTINSGTVNLSDCIFTNNTSGFAGGAIYNRYILNVEGCIFTNNNATSFGGAIAAGRGNNTITGCTFNGNTANDGGAIAAGSADICTVNGCTFIGNSADSSGGGIYGSSIITANFNRFYNNQGLYGSAIRASPTPNVENNWWGSNNPNFSSLINGTAPTQWLFMTINATPSIINNTQTSLITVSFNNRYDGITITPYIPNIGEYIPDGTPVTFSLTNGPFGTLTAPLTVNTTGGISSIVFTASYVGVQDVNGTLDDQNVTTSITINPAAYVDIFKEFRDVPWGNVITTAYYNDRIYALVHVGNSGPDSTSISVLDSFIGFNWTGTYYVLRYVIPNIEDNWEVNDSVNVFNGTHWNIPDLSHGLGGNSMWLAIEGVINQTGAVSNHAETVDQSAYPYQGYDTYTAYLTANTAPTNITIVNTTGNKDKTVTLNATLKDYLNNPLSGKTVEFYVNNAKIGENTTNTNGLATLNYNIDLIGGTYNTTALFAGDNTYAASNGNGTLKVNQSSVYVNITASKNNPTVGETITLTFKLGNNGPDPADDVVFTYVIPEGMEFVSIETEPGYPQATYNATTRTITWPLGTVPKLDPWIKLNVLVLNSGAFNINPIVTTSTYDPTLGNDIQHITINAVQAASAVTSTRTIGMQETGIPINYLILAILAVLAGLAGSRRK